MDTSTALTEYQVIIKNLKKILKDLKIPYKDLADEIGMSESGIKKIFLANDGSFQRLSQICQVVGVSLHELLQDNKTLEVSFNKNQQDAFLKDVILLKIYWMLVYERQSAPTVQTRLKLNSKDLFHRLRKLDSLKLLKLLPNDRLQLPSVKGVRWAGDGEFMNKIHREWSRHLFESVSKPKAKADEFFLIRYLPMTPKTYKEFQFALASLEEEFLRRSIHEMRTKGSETQHVRWMVVADNKSFISDL